MSESSSTHGPRQDDALKRETRSEVQAGRATRSEEWREPEPPGEDQPDATWAPAGQPGSAPPAEDFEAIQLRSDLARHLDAAAFPAGRGHLVETLAAHHAPQRLLDIVAGLPEDARFANLHELLTALGLPIESRPRGDGS
jgi:Protein of unknown function (DUF2795)